MHKIGLLFLSSNYMQTATQSRTRPEPKNGHRPPSRAANALETLTLEHVLYEIELIENAGWALAQRRGHSWYDPDGGALAEAPQIRAIRIPARCH